MSNQNEASLFVKKDNYTFDVNGKPTHFWLVSGHGTVIEEEDIKPVTDDDVGEYAYVEFIFQVPQNTTLISPNVCGHASYDPDQRLYLKYLVNPLSFINGSLFQSSNKLFQEYARHARVYNKMARNSSLTINPNEEDNVVQGVFLASSTNALIKDNKALYDLHLPKGNNVHSADFKARLTRKGPYNVDFLDLTAYFAPNTTIYFDDLIQKITELDTNAHHVIVYSHCERFPDYYKTFERETAFTKTNLLLMVYEQADATSFPLKDLKMDRIKYFPSSEPQFTDNTAYSYSSNPFAALQQKGRLKQTPIYKVHKERIIKKLREKAKTKSLQPMVQTAKKAVAQQQVQPLQQCGPPTVFQIDGVKYELRNFDLDEMGNKVFDYDEDEDEDYEYDKYIVVRKVGREAVFFHYTISVSFSKNKFFIDLEKANVAELFKGNNYSMPQLMKNKVFSSSLIKAIKCFKGGGDYSKIRLNFKNDYYPEKPRTIASLIKRGVMYAPFGYKKMVVQTQSKRREAKRGKQQRQQLKKRSK